MTPNELSLMTRIVTLRCAYEESNPEVGMGPFPQSIVRDECRRAAIIPTAQEVRLLTEVARQRLYP